MNHRHHPSDSLPKRIDSQIGYENPYPLLDISETHSHYILSLDLEETLGDEVRVELSEEELIIRGFGRPLSRGKNPRSLTLRTHSNDQTISATLRNGKLFLALPKSKESITQTSEA